MVKKRYNLKNKKYNENRDGQESGFRIFFMLLFIILCIVFIGFMAYLLYINVPGSPENLNFKIERNKIVNMSYAEVQQFYPNMKFNHNLISYSVDTGCEQQKKDRMESAFNEIAIAVGVISFIEKSDNADVLVLCSINEKAVPSKENYFIAGEGGAKEIVPTGKYNVITEGVVLLYGDKNSLNCKEPNIEIHEIMHVLGFNHSSNPDSLMYAFLESCSQKIDDSIIKELKRLYSEENLPELYFDDVSAVKKGRYLDFNLTIRNSGDADAYAVKYSIFDDGELVETKTVEDIKYGAGIVVHIENFKLIHRDPSEIKFVIDSENAIKESDKKNNFAVVKLAA